MSKGRGIDFNAVNAAALAQLASLIEAWLPEGRREGEEWVARNPTRADRKAGSFKVNLVTGRWSDFACGDKGGDPISLCAYLFHADDQMAGAKDLAAQLGLLDTAGAPARDYTPHAAPAKAKKAEDAEWRVVMPVPEDAPAPPEEFARREDGKLVRYPIAHRWAYHDAEGRVIGYVARIELPDGGKDVIPQTFCENARGERKWKWLSFPKPRPLYNLHKLAARPNASVILVEGEKAADAGERLLPGVVVMTWPGGCKAIKHVDWSPLAGRKVAGWPDADLAGIQAMAGCWDERKHKPEPGIAQLLAGIAAGVRIVDPPMHFKQGWDLADCEAVGWSAREVNDWLMSHMREPPALEPPRSVAPPAAAEDTAPPEWEAPPTEYFDEPPLPLAPETEGLDEAPFRLLGFDHGVYYYLAAGSLQVIRLPAAAHAKASLMTIAPLQWWERAYPGKKGASWDMAANALIQQQHRVGPYDPTRVRGRGAWFDDGRSVLHLGDRLIVSGRLTGIREFATRYIYEAGVPLRLDIANPLAAAEAVRFVKLCELLAWEKPIFGRLLAGWCFLAPICGALKWRPHIWIAGAASSGKSWIADNIITRSLGDTALSVQGETSEAGIRQRLGNDARPIVFDEAESEDTRARARIQAVMALMRQASSDNAAAILKGSANSGAQEYRIRSMFAFSSINVGTQQYADKTRVTVLTLTANRAPRAAAEHFRQVKTLWAEVLTEEFVRRLHARAVRLIPVIRRNAEIFAEAGAEVIGTRRLGDQIGTLLAGCYAMFSSREITPEAARAWIAGQTWEEEGGMQEARDELLCLSHIMQHTVHVQGVNRTYERAIGEAVDLVTGELRDMEIPREAAHAALLRTGIKVEEFAILVATNHAALARILRETPWANNWGVVLKRLDGASITAQPVRFGAGTRSRAIRIPLTAL